jgi:hypothetical protein
MNLIETRSNPNHSLILSFSSYAYTLCVPGNHQWTYFLVTVDPYLMNIVNVKKTKIFKYVHIYGMQVLEKITKVPTYPRNFK